MIDQKKLPSVKLLGISSNVLSCLMTIILCLPLPIIFFFLQKRMTRIFSIYNCFIEYRVGKMDLEKFSKKLKNTKIGLFAFAFIWLLISVLVFINTDLSKMDNFWGNLIVILPIFLTIPGIILCRKVSNILEN